MKRNWKVKDTGASAKIVDGNGGGTIATIIVTSKGMPEEKKANARLIVEAVNSHERLTERVKELNKVIDAINNLSGRASVGHGGECECSSCLIHSLAFKAWKDA